MARAKKKEDPFPAEDVEFQIAPMIDVLLVILVFFMSITSVEVMRTNKEVLLPMAQSGQKKENNKDQSVINIVWRGETLEPAVDIDGASATDDMSVVTKRLAAAISVTPGHRAVIRADKEVQYQFIQRVMGACAEAECPNVEFAVVDKEGAPRPGRS